jgi:hypothetical protein
MHTISERSFKSFSWSTLVVFALGFWLSGSALLDFVIIPSLWVTGMMNQSGFANVGYTIFGVFNRIELLCAASVLTACLILCSHQLVRDRVANHERLLLVLSGLLMLIPIIYTYVFTPQMSSLGMNLNVFEVATDMPAAMISLHEGYWLLEAIKFFAGVSLIRWFYRNYFSTAQAS